MINCMSSDGLQYTTEISEKRVSSLIPLHIHFLATTFLLSQIDKGKYIFSRFAFTLDFILWNVFCLRYEVTMLQY